MMLLFRKLIFNPEISSNHRKILLIVRIYSAVASPKNTVSSAKCGKDIRILCTPTGIPVKQIKSLHNNNWNSFNATFFVSINMNQETNDSRIEHENKTGTNN